MDAPLSHSSAARYWLACGSPDVVGVAGFCAAASSCHPQAGGAWPSGHPRNRDLPPGSTQWIRPILDAPSHETVRQALEMQWTGESAHFLVSRQSYRRKRAGVIMHSCSRPLPPRSIVRLENGLCVCSPELTFVQMGTVLSKPLLVWLGMQFCGIHALSPLDDRKSHALRFEDRGLARCIPARSQITTPKNLLAFVESCSDLDGSRKAMSALRYVVERSRSPMESVIALLFSLPARYGGFGLPKPKLNCRVSLPSWLHQGAVRPTWHQKPFAECDLAFINRSRTVAVDYHGEGFHSAEVNIHHDSLKLNAFEDLHLPYFTLTKRQVFDYDLFEKVAGQIRSSLGLGRDTSIGDARVRRKALHRELVDAIRIGMLNALDSKR